jgi:hypothetical protein
MRGRGGYIGANVTPASAAVNSAASGVWTVRDAESLKRAGTWPIALIPLLNVDGLSGALAAVSIRRLNSAYTGPCMRVRRSSDNAEQDIQFSGNYCDESSITSFVGGGNGFVVKWYDQSGNGNDAGAVSFANAIRFQPRVVTSGTLMTRGGRVALDFTQNAYSFEDNAIGMHISGLSISATNWMAAGVIHTDSTAWQSPIAFVYGRWMSIGSAGVNDYDNTSSVTMIAANNANTEYPNTHNVAVNLIGAARSGLIANARYVMTAYKSSSAIFSGINANVSTATVSGSLSATRITLGITNNYGATDKSGFGGQMQEVVFWPSDKSSQVAAIRQNINEFLSVY